MGWFNRSKEIAELRKQIAALSQHVGQLSQPRGFDPGEFLQALMDGQVKQVGSMTDFMRMISEVASERAASALGRRGGRKRAASAQRDARGRMLPAKKVASDCRLCDDHTIADFTAAEFDEHQKHKGRPRQVTPERVEPTAEEREVIEREPIEVRTPTQYPLPAVQYPMESTASGHQDSGAGSHPESEEPAHPGHRNGVA